MTSDIEVVVGGPGVDLIAVEGLSDEGIDFVDSYQSADIVVVDIGRIVLPASSRRPLVEQARAAALEVEERDA